MVQALSYLIDDIVNLPGEGNASIDLLRRELFKDSYGQGSFDLNEKADAAEAYFRILECIH